MERKSAAPAAASARKTLDSAFIQAHLRSLGRDSAQSVTQLKFTNLGIAKIGADVKCPALRRIDLSGNHLTSTAGIEKFAELDYLMLKNNAVASLEGCGKLAKLRVLDVSSNHLTEQGCAALSALAELRAVVLNNNQLKQLPKLTRLSRLTALVASHNQLSSIPNLASSPDLTKLSLSHNQIAEIPATLSSNKAVRRASLRCCTHAGAHCTTSAFWLLCCRLLLCSWVSCG